MSTSERSAARQPTAPDADTITNLIDGRTSGFAQPEVTDTVGAPPRPGGMSRRALLRSVGVGGLALVGAGAVTRGFGVPSLFEGVGGQTAGAMTTSCSATSRINEIRIVAGNMASVVGNSGPDAWRTGDGGATFSNAVAPAIGTFVPYTTGTNGVPGSFGIAGDHGCVLIFDQPANTWRVGYPGGSSIITGLAGNGNFWVAVSTDGKFWYTNNNGASWGSPSNGRYLNYASIASILSVYDLEYANGVWVGCGYDTLGVGRTFWRSTKPNPTRGAKNSWFSVSGGDFAEIKGGGDGNAVSVYSVAFAGSCTPNTWYGSGNFGTVWRSTDNGGTWNKWRDTGSQILYGVDANPLTGKVICAGGVEGIIEVHPNVVQRYSTGGSKSIYDIAWVGANDWVATGDYGKILVSHDDGATWSVGEAALLQFQLFNTGIVKPW